jgi:hypothetical protein
VKQAKIIADYIARELLPLRERIFIVTSQGVHAQNGIAHLKEEMIAYFRGMSRANCGVEPTNPGVLIISKRIDSPQTFSFCFSLTTVFRKI